MERQIEIWQRMEILEFPTETSWKNEIKRMKREYKDKPDYRIKGVKIKSPETDENLTGIEKQVFHNKKELPKMTREERLKRFKNG